MVFLSLAFSDILFLDSGLCMGLLNFIKADWAACCSDRDENFFFGLPPFQLELPLPLLCGRGPLIFSLLLSECFLPKNGFFQPYSTGATPLLLLKKSWRNPAFIRRNTVLSHFCESLGFKNVFRISKSKALTPCSLISSLITLLEVKYVTQNSLGWQSLAHLEP